MARAAAVTFVTASSVVAVPLEVAIARLMADTVGIVGAGLRAVERNGDRLAGRVHPPGPLAVLGPLVDATVGRPLALGDRVVVPLCWRPRRAPALFPALDAEVALGRAGPAATTVSVAGSYRPPGGAVGSSADRVVLHRIGQATMAAVVTGIAQALADEDAAAVAG
jgi:hypothetical protein